MTDLALEARRIVVAAVRAVQAPALRHYIDLEALAGRRVEAFGRVVVVGAGKASAALAGVLEGGHAEAGLALEGEVAIPDGYPDLPPSMPTPQRIRVVRAGHPVPTAASARAAGRALEAARSAGPEDLVVALISGGGSALWALPPPGVRLEDVRATTRSLLASGASIEDVNAVRKHLSQIAGGRLAQAAAPARLVALVLSDVVGDDLATVASGPTVPDPTTFTDALEVVTGLAVPASVRRHLERGAAGEVPETTGPDDPSLATSRTTLIGSNVAALEAAAREARRRGYAVEVERGVQGEAREVGARMARRALEAAPGTALVWGGETTVTVAGSGRGGRNQEVALAAALVLEDAGIEGVVLSAGTDGVDGPTGAAGGWATPATAGSVRAAGLDPDARLANNDAYAALEAAGTLLVTGPTHTNVADIGVALRT